VNIRGSYVLAIAPTLKPATAILHVYFPLQSLYFRPTNYLIHFSDLALKKSQSSSIIYVRSRSYFGKRWEMSQRCAFTFFSRHVISFRPNQWFLWAQRHVKSRFKGLHDAMLSPDSRMHTWLVLDLDLHQRCFLVKFTAQHRSVLITASVSGWDSSK